MLHTSSTYMLYALGNVMKAYLSIVAILLLDKSLKKSVSVILSIETTNIDIS